MKREQKDQKFRRKAIEVLKFKRRDATERGTRGGKALGKEIRDHD